MTSLSRLTAELHAFVRWGAFWSAVVLPFLYLPLLATGLDGTAMQLAFVGLLAVNVVAIVLGRNHARPITSTGPEHDSTTGQGST